ncbi:chromosomal replication initiator protein DnaA [Candidatus Poribacteria bacterium]|nr:chromosomal replication initiator protein DnaA [Candidatus Poribacteria bacterium]MYK22326.1 chromosomal replication initiator protein DnaA [Candidatus Poribacteria bacterium]
MRHTPNEIWSEILENLNDTAQQDVYLHQAVPLSLTADALKIAVPSAYTRARIEERFRTDIQRVLATLIGAQCVFTLTIDESVARGSEDPNAIDSEETSDQVIDQNQVSVSAPPSPQNQTGLNSRYRFDTFVVDTPNRICHATALAVSENPGRDYNPLFIYGGVGLGKTHLLHAIGNRLSANQPHKKVLYVTSETFMNEYIESIVNRGSAQGFRTKYRTADMLLIDDIQFLERKEGTQEEFFNTFNELHMNSNQIVMTSDRTPNNLENLEVRLRSRFQSGMVAEIGMPQYEMRIAILRQKCQDQEFENLPDDVLSYIAEVVETNIRELEGTLVRLVTQATILKENLSLDFARQVLSDVGTPSPMRDRKTATSKGIQMVVADYFGIEVADLISMKRTKELVQPRQIAMYMCRELTQMSYSNIAQAFNRENHTTVIHACKQIENTIEKSDEERQTIIFLLDQFR